MRGAPRPKARCWRWTSRSRCNATGWPPCSAPDRTAAWPSAPPALKLARSFGLPPALGLDLLGRRPDVVAARLQAEAQASRIEQKKAEFYPNVNLSAFIGVQALGLDMLTRSGSGVGAVGPAISLPIFSGGRLQGELRGAHARHAEAVASYNATVAHALQEVATAAVSQRALGGSGWPRPRKRSTPPPRRTAWPQPLRRRPGHLPRSADRGRRAARRPGRADQPALARRSSLDIGLQRALGGGYQAGGRARAAASSRIKEPA